MFVDDGRAKLVGNDIKMMNADLQILIELTATASSGLLLHAIKLNLIIKIVKKCVALISIRTAHSFRDYAYCLQTEAKLQRIHVRPEELIELTATA